SDGRTGSCWRRLSARRSSWSWPCSSCGTMAAFLDVILRGLALSGQAVAIGGVLFALLVYRVQDGAGARRIWTLVAAAAAVVVGALAVRRAPRVGTWWPLLLGAVVALVVSAAWTSHAAARLDHRALLLALDAVHQLAAAAWIGGLLHLVVTALHRDPVAGRA